MFYIAFSCFLQRIIYTLLYFIPFNCTWLMHVRLLRSFNKSWKLEDGSWFRGVFLISKFTAEYASVRIMKIGQYMHKSKDK